MAGSPSEKAAKCICLVYGLPACGKSWLCGRLSAALTEEAAVSVDVLDFDAFLPGAVRDNQFSPEAWKVRSQGLTASSPVQTQC